MAFFLNPIPNQPLTFYQNLSMTFKSLNFEKNCKPIKMTLTWNIPNYFLLKTKNTQNTLTTIYSKQIFATLTQHFIGYPENR